MELSSIIQTALNIRLAYNQLCQPILNKYNLLQPSFDILMFLDKNPEFCTAKDICKYRNMKKNLVSIHVDKLVSTGYLTRNGIAGDRRKIKLTCTKKALPIIKEGHKIQNSFCNQLIGNISKEKLEEMKEIFENINCNALTIINE